MKRQHYYQVHKNKKPKKLRKPKPDVFKSMIALEIATTAIQLAIIKSKPFIGGLTKVSESIKAMANLGISITEMQKKRNANRYLNFK